jgi:hypothetical protein
VPEDGLPGSLLTAFPAPLQHITANAAGEADLSTIALYQTAIAAGEGEQWHDGVANIQISEMCLECKPIVVTRYVLARKEGPFFKRSSRIDEHLRG